MQLLGFVQETLEADEIQVQAFWFHQSEWPRSQEGTQKEDIHHLLLNLMAHKATQTSLRKVLIMENIAQFQWKQCCRSWFQVLNKYLYHCY